MRLFLNDKEARLIRLCLSMERGCMTDDQQATVDRIIFRMDLCDQLKNNERRSKEDGGL